MGNVLVENSYLKAIANAIRNKLGVTTKYKPSEMAGAINSIVGQATLGTKTITANGTYDAEDDSLDGYSEVTVEVTPTGTKQISITQNGTTTENVADYASAEITVNVSGGSTNVYTGTITPTERVATATFYAPGMTKFAIYPTTAPALDTGHAFFGGGAGVAGRFYGARSVDAGTSLTGGVNPTMTIAKSGDNFVLTFQGNEPKLKCLQVGITYEWIAW